MKPGTRRNLTLGLAALCSAAAAGRILRGRPREADKFGLVASAALLGPTLLPNFPWFGPVLRHFATDRREVWLTIDDGPDPHDTPAILEVLARHRARATFFVIGSKVWRYPGAARAIVAAGHDLQNHTWSHPACSFWAATPGCARREISAATAAIRQVTGQTPSLFRAPAGLANPFVHHAAARAGLRLAGWSASGLDGIRHEPDRVLDRILLGLRPGAVILLHEGPVAGLRPGTRARTLDRLLRELGARGYRTTAAPL